MYCSNCGTQIPDDANFCFKCGKPQRTNIQSDEPKWETCEIFYQKSTEGLTGTRGNFYAESIGPDGVKKFARTEEFGCGYNCWEPERDNRKIVQIHQELITLLVKNGWESLGTRGENWWSARFRRKFQTDSGEGKAHFNVVLTAAGKQKIEMIGAIRRLTKCGLEEAKTLVGSPGAVILHDVSKEEADYAKQALEKAGGTVILQ